MNGHQKNPKSIRFGQSARKKLLEGAQILTRAVAVTYGPMGRNVLLDRFGGLLMTKDGVTVAREIDLQDNLMNCGSAILKEACLKTNDEAGDGTTTTAILTTAILQEGNKQVVAGCHPGELVKGIREAAKFAETLIYELSTPVEDGGVLKNVALIASNGDIEVAENLTEACLAVGKDGSVVIEEGEAREIILDFKEGVELPFGPISPYFMKDKEERTLESPLIVVIPQKLSAAADVISIMEESSQFPDNELVIFAESIEGEALQVMLMNDQKGIVPCVGFGASGLGLHRKGPMSDLAALAGCEIVDPEAGADHRTFKSEDFGSYRKISIQSNKTIITAYAEAQPSIDAQIQKIQNELQIATHDFDRDKLTERAAKLQGGFCVLKVGGTTEIEIKERRARIEDALGSLQAALKEGVVPGGGSSLLAASSYLYERGFEEGEFGLGQKILADALKAPLYQLAKNAGYEGAVIADKVQTSWGGEIGEWSGWDLIQGEIRDLGADPMIIDPVLVVVTALSAAVSVATTLLTVEGAITNHGG